MSPPELLRHSLSPRTKTIPFQNNQDQHSQHVPLGI